MTNSQTAIRQFSFPHDYDRTVTFWRGIEKGMNVGRSDTPEEIQKSSNVIQIYFCLLK